MTDSRPPEILRYTAFTDRPDGGNPAGLVLDSAGLDSAEMQRLAAEIGYSESAFLTAADGPEGTRVYDVRYFTPEVEVPFCGHATIAAVVALAERDGPGAVELRSPACPLAVETRSDERGRLIATMTTVAPESYEVAPADVDDALSALGWTRDDLDPRIPPRVAFAGARHLILAARRREVLTVLDYDYHALADVGRRLDLITIALIWREDASSFRARNVGPSVGIREDPATGAAAAAFGAYLRALGLVDPPATATLHQGDDLGRPSVLMVAIPPGDAGIDVTGTAVRLP